jgi:hypothetical protein
MKGAIIYTWGSAVRGREKEALDVFSQAMAHTEEQQKKGIVESSSVYFAQSGNLSAFSGIQVVTGEAAALRASRLEADSIKLELLASAIVENFTVIECLGGDDATIQALIGFSLEAEQQLGLV